MQLYRFLTGADDSSFCHKVTKALSEGWELYGGPTLGQGADGAAICGQAVIKQVKDQPCDLHTKHVEYDETPHKS